MFAVNLALALNLIILFVGFFFKKNNSLPNRVLALILLDTAISFLGNASITGNFFDSFPYFFFLSWSTSSFFGPLVFAYTALFTGSRLKLTHPLWLASFVLFIFGGSLPVSYILLPVGQRSAFALSLLHDPLPWQMTVINIIGMLLIWVSVVVSAIKIRRYKLRLMATLSSMEKTRLSFISRFVTLIALLTLASTVLYLILPEYLVEYLYLPCLITLIYFFILFYTFRDHAIFTTETYGQFRQDTLPANEQAAKDEEVENALPESELQGLAKRIDGYLEQTEAYTNPDISIRVLADAINETVGKISAAINKEMHKNFFDLINEKRVHKARLLLTEKMDKMTIESIAYESGFNSRASFYRAFKKYTSLSPSDYLKQLSSQGQQKN